MFFVGLKLNDRKPEAVIDKETLAQSVQEAEEKKPENLEVNGDTVHVVEEGNEVDENGKIVESVEHTEAEEADFNSDAEENKETQDEETVAQEGAPEVKDSEELKTPAAEEANLSEHINPLPEGEDGYVAGEETVKITIVRGDSSVSVSRRLFEAGLIESAVEFDQYLCNNGYDKRISVGNYEIPYGLDFEGIAKTIAR